MDEQQYNTYAVPSYQDMVRAQSAFINRVYTWMSIGLALTGFIAWFLGERNIEFVIKHQQWFLPLIVVEVLLVIAMSWMINKISPAVASVMFFIYAAINGVTLSWIFLAYQIGSIANVFFITCGTFAGSSCGFCRRRTCFELSHGEGQVGIELTHVGILVVGIPEHKEHLAPFQLCADIVKVSHVSR